MELAHSEKMSLEEVCPTVQHFFLFAASSTKVWKQKRKLLLSQFVVIENWRNYLKKQNEKSLF